MGSRIRFPFYIFFLNPVYVAARSLPSLGSRNLGPKQNDYGQLEKRELGKPVRADAFRKSKNVPVLNVIRKAPYNPLIISL